MHIIVGTVADLEDKSMKLPAKLEEYIRGILTILDTEYGADRRILEDDGGFVFVGEKVSDLSAIKDYIDANDAIYEHLDVIPAGRDKYAVALYLSNNEYGIHVVMPINAIPDSWKEDLPDEI